MGAIGLAGELLDPESRRQLLAHIADFTLTCQHVGPSDGVVVLSVPPQQRFD